LRAENPLAPWPTSMLIPDQLCEMGRFGQKTGLGWYRYGKGRREALADPAVDALIEQHRQAQGITARRISPEEIVQRCIYALVNEGARILEEGIAQRASDIDIVYLFGYGFPAWRGGPMLYADTQGLLAVERAMEGFARQSKDASTHWTPAPLLRRLAAEGKTFN
jgi:3-hydroxyacyl-CoA dehydrogenase